MYRRKSSSVICAVAGLAGIFAVALPAAVGPGNAAFRAVFISLGLVLAAWAFRAAYAYVRADANGVRVLNPLRTRRFAWSEISHFALGRWGVLPRQGIIHLRDGTSFGTWAISGTNPGIRRTDRVVEEMVNDLNSRLAEATR